MDIEKELGALNHAVHALKELSAEGREYLLDRFWNDAEISAEQKRRIIRRAAQPYTQATGGPHNDDVVFLTKEQAIAMLPDSEDIHTFRGTVIPCGAHWERELILEAIEKYQFELTGPAATAMNHGMGFRDEHGWVFVETRPTLHEPDAANGRPSEEK